MAKLNYWTFKKNESLMSDEMINKAVKRLEERWQRIADYFYQHDREAVCTKCGNEEFDYFHNRAECLSCGNKVEKEISHQEAVKIGCATRTISGCIRELLGSELAAKARNETPSKEQLRDLPFSLQEFNDIQYTEAERGYLNRRYQELLDEIGGSGNRVDMFLTYKLAHQELKILNLDRLDTFEDVDSMVRKREMEIYEKLLNKLKAAKADRDEVEDKTIIQQVAEKALAMGLDKKVQEHVGYLEGEHKRYLEEAEERRKKAGNPY